MINQPPVKDFDYEINLTIDSDLNCGLAMQYSTEGIYRALRTIYIAARG